MRRLRAPPAALFYYSRDRLSMGLDPEDGCLWIYDIDQREVQAFTPYGIECLQQIIADERADGRAPKPKEKP